MERHVLLASDLIKIFGISESAAHKRMGFYRDALGKEKRKPITLREFCKYEQVDYSEIIAILKLKNAA